MTTAELDQINLAKGSHNDPQAGLCLLEAVAYVAGEPHSDHPSCTSTVLGTFGRPLSDVLPDDLRQELKPLIPSLIGTRDDGHDETRSLMALDWLIRTWLPAWLQLADLQADATALRELAQIVDVDTAAAAGPIVRQAQEKARAKKDVDGYAAWDAGRYAGGAAAWDAARDAGRDAGGAAASGCAARDAGGAAAKDAAKDTAWYAAGYAARCATRDAARAGARHAARHAARGHLAPTVAELQRSAIDLYRRMITVHTP